MILIHHLTISQSERIPWICEELNIPYELKIYPRDPATRGGPAVYKQLNFMGIAPVMQDGDVTMGESGAIVEYLSHTYGGGRLFVKPGAPNYADFLFWWNFSNGTFMPAAMMAIVAVMGGKDVTERDRQRAGRYELCYKLIEKRLGEAPYFAGSEFTVADIMMLFPMTRMREFMPRDLSNSPNLLAYLQRIGARPAYRRAMQKGDSTLPPKLT